MRSTKVVPSNHNNNSVSTNTENTQLGRNTIVRQPSKDNNNNNSNSNIDIIVKQSTLALEVDIVINNEEGRNTIYKLKGSTLDWLMLVDCDFGGLGKFDILLSGEEEVFRIISGIYSFFRRY